MARDLCIGWGGVRSQIYFRPGCFCIIAIGNADSGLNPGGGPGDDRDTNPYAGTGADPGASANSYTGAHAASHCHPDCNARANAN